MRIVIREALPHAHLGVASTPTAVSSVPLPRMRVSFSYFPSKTIAGTSHTSGAGESIARVVEALRVPTRRTVFTERQAKKSGPRDFQQPTEDVARGS